MDKHSLIRTIYLYAFALLGLVLLVISGIRFLDMGLKAFVFTKADDQQKLEYMRPPVYCSIEALEKIGEGGELTEKEGTELARLLVDYKAWEEIESDVDPITSRRHRDASFNLSMILIGLPLYIYHWRIIKTSYKS